MGSGMEMAKISPPSILASTPNWKIWNGGRENFTLID